MSEKRTQLAMAVGLGIGYLATWFSVTAGRKPQKPGAPEFRAWDLKPAATRVDTASAKEGSTPREKPRFRIPHKYHVEISRVTAHERDDAARAIREQFNHNLLEAEKIVLAACIEGTAIASQSPLPFDVADTKKLEINERAMAERKAFRAVLTIA